MIVEAISKRKNGALSDADDRGCGALRFNAEDDAERVFLTSLYFLFAPAIPRNADCERKLVAVTRLEQWLRVQRSRINMQIAEAKSK